MAGKIVGADGSLESAGGTVFSDRSAGLIGNGAWEVSAPWIDYARPVCWAPGIVAMATASIWNEVPLPEHVEGAAFLQELGGALWARSHPVHFRPDVVAVRVGTVGTTVPTPQRETVWNRVLDLRPDRPSDLTDGAWRYLLAHDDVDACLP